MEEAMQSSCFRYTRRLAPLAALWIILLTAVAAYADNSKISTDLLPLLGNSGSVNVIVQYNTAPQTCSSGFLGGLICSVTNCVGGVVSVLFGLIDAVLATVQLSDIVTLSNQSNVIYISLDRQVSATLDYSTAAVNASVDWSEGLDGTGVGIAVIDSGVYSHPDLTAAGSSSSRVVYRQSFIGGGNQYDDYGHGTHVAGIAAGNGHTSLGAGSFRSLRGIASNANILDLRGLDKNGMSTDSAVIAALQQPVNPTKTYNVRLINLFIGPPIYEKCNL